MNENVKGILWILFLILISPVLIPVILLWALTGILYSLTVTEPVYKKTTALARFLGWFTNWMILFITRSHVEVLGEDKIPENSRFVYVANHRSRFDPMVVMSSLARFRIGFISKPSNFRIPFFGKILRKLCFLQINREDPRKAIETVNDAVDILNLDSASIGFYPEGTRSADGTLGPFHDFMFRIPKCADVPVVVAVTYGTEDVAKKFPFPGGARATIKILGVIDTEFVRTHRPVEIGEKVEAMMREELNQEETTR